ncbi:MAG: hypothetical protein ABFD82_18290 [Syntrophaceae bacterium]
MTLSKAQRSKAFREKNKKLGLCPVCGKEADGYYCAYHRKKNNEYSQALRKVRKENGNCTRCSAPLDPDIDAGCSVCINCRDRIYFL